MPYLSFDLDALARMPRAAAVAGTQPGTIAYGLLQMWEHAWREKTAEISETMLLSCFPGVEPRMLEEALTAFKFAERVSPTTFRVRGAERYLRISQARSAGGKKAAGNLNRGLQPAGGRAGAQPGTTPGSLPAPSRLEPGTTPGSVPALTASIRAASSEHSSSEYNSGVGGFEDEVGRIFKAIRGADYDPPITDAIASRTLLAKYGEPETLRRWQISLRKKFPACSTLSTLLARWNDFAAADEPAVGAKPPVRKISASDHPAEPKSYDTL